jgi:hypothetical protein
MFICSFCSLLFRQRRADICDNTPTPKKRKGFFAIRRKKVRNPCIYAGFMAKDFLKITP